MHPRLLNYSPRYRQASGMAAYVYQHSKPWLKNYAAHAVPISAAYALRGKARGPALKGAAAPIQGRRTGQRRRRRVKGKGLKRDISKINRAIREMKHHDDATTGTMTYRKLTEGQVGTSINNRQANADFAGSNVTELQSALGSLKFFDPSNPGTLLTADGTTGTYQRNYLFDSVSSRILVRNNYQVDAKVKIYLCKCKDDTSQSPSAAWSAGYVDGSNASSVDQLNQYPTDYDIVNDLWDLKVASSSTLSPGQSVSCSHSSGSFEFDPATYDTHALTYQKEYKSFSWLVVVEGALSHDTVADGRGLARGAVDVMLYQTYKVKYSAGVNIKYVVLSETLDSMSTLAVQSQKPVSDNQSYSAT